VQDKLDSNPDLSKLKLKVVDVVLVNKVGNEYKGMVTVKTSAGKRHDVAIDVTADGDNVIWETTSPGAFAFAAQEEPASPPPAQPAVAPPLGPNSLPVRNGMAYIVTKSGKTRCQISRSEVDCQAPLVNAPLVNGYPADGVRFLTDGSLQWVSGDLGDVPVTPIGYGTYRGLSWTIDASGAGTRFTHDGTGRSLFFSLDRVTVG
jgi:hypothetical protein